MLQKGIYEHIINQDTEQEIQEAEQSGLACTHLPIDSAEAPKVLADYLANAIRQRLEDIDEQAERVT